VAISTENSIPFRSDIQRVIGGNRQIRTTQKFPPGVLGEDGAWRNTDCAIVEIGPRRICPPKPIPI
jgi:hypothetical protein